MSNQAVYVGLDIGYGTLDGVCSHHDGGKKPFFFNMPSLVSEAINDDMEFESKVLNKRNVERVMVNERMYHVGEDAGNTIKELNEDFIHTDHYMALYLAGLTRFKQKKIDHLVTGLPVNQYAKLKDALKARLEGTHLINDKLSVDVKRVTIIPQPMGSLIDHCIKKNIKNRRTLSLVVIDPGHFSFDWLVVRNGSIDYAQSGSLNEGVGAVIDEIHRQIAKDHDNDSPSHAKIDIALRNNDATITMYGKAINLKTYIDRAMSKQGGNAVRILKNTITNLQDIDSFILTGGGAKLYEKVIETAFKKHKVEVLNDSVMANARGYYNQAQR